MIVLHGTWKPPAAIEKSGDFFLWGETSSSAKLKRRGRPRASIEHSHPFQASKDDILKIITSLEPANSVIKNARLDSVFITLPSISNYPQASPDLIKEDFNKKMEKYYEEISRKAIETAYGEAGKKKK